MKRKKTDFDWILNLPKDLQYLILSHVIQVDSTHLRNYQHIVYLTHAFKDTIMPLCLSQALQKLPPFMPPLKLRALLGVRGLHDLMENKSVFIAFASFYRHLTPIVKFNPCYQRNCILLSSFNGLSLHSHGVITYHGHVIGFEDFVRRFKAIINKKIS